MLQVKVSEHLDKVMTDVFYDSDLPNILQQRGSSQSSDLKV